MTRKPALTSAERKAPTCRPAPGFSSLHARGWPLPPCSAARPSQPAAHRAHTPGSALDATPRAPSPAPLLSPKGAKLDWDQAHGVALGPSAVWPSSSRPPRGSLWAVFPALCSSRVKAASSRTEGPGEGCGQHHLVLLSRLKADSGSLRHSRPGPGAPGLPAARISTRRVQASPARPHPYGDRSHTRPPIGLSLRPACCRLPRPRGLERAQSRARRRGPDPLCSPHRPAEPAAEQPARLQQGLGRLLQKTE